MQRVGLLRSMASKATRARVFVTRKVPEEALAMLRERCDVSGWWSDAAIPRAELEAGVAEAEALFCLLTDRIDAALLEKAPKLRVLGTMSVGADHIDLEACKARSLRVGYTPDVLTEATAELTISLLLATARRLPEAQAAVHSGAWGTWAPMWMCGQGIQESVVGVVGLGRIGASVAEKIVPFHPAKLLYHSPKAKPSVAEKLNARYVSLEELVSESDFVICCCPLNDDTKGLFSSELFGKMKKGAVFVNTSRGGVVDQEALEAALRSGDVGCAGLDVTTPEPLPPSHPLLSLPNCLVLPHIGSATRRSRTAMATLTAANILAGLEDRKMPAALLPGRILI